ncbi:DUF3558 family protein [Nocardia sp. NPDC006630]|uniref:DUF3558 family protein n=1 Tax=Nocardia sp. NPDC006630 TaxID=3157181 RepID=UPI0033B0297B
MRALSGKVSVVLLAALLLSACGTPGRDTPAAAPASSKPQVAAPSVDVGLCGSADAGQVGTQSGLGAVTLVSSDALLCRWEAQDGSSVTFRWFRGSPIDRYHSDTATSVKRDGVDIVGRSGYSWRGAHSCEAAVPTGDADFIAWTVDSAAATPDAACAAVDRLASATLAKG